jgi:hypothetical protein
MKTMVLDTLDRPAIRQFAFGFANLYINALLFEEVKNAIKNDKITVTHSSKMSSLDAKYVYKKNKLVLGFKKTGGNTDREALIVHECVHALLDIQMKLVSVQQSEAAAYIAQCLYYYYRNEEAFQGGAEATFGDPLLQAAWGVSAKCRKNSSVKDADLQPLYAAISTHSKYKDRYADTEGFDGV